MIHVNDCHTSKTSSLAICLFYRFNLILMEELECKGTTHSIRFTSSQPITLHGVVVYGCLEGSAIYQVKVEIKEEKSERQSNSEITKDVKTKQFFLDTTNFDLLDAKLRRLDMTKERSETDSMMREDGDERKLHDDALHEPVARDANVTHLTIATERTIHTYDVMLSKTVTVIPGKTYSCHLEMDGPPTKLGFHGKGDVSSEGVTFHFSNPERSSSNVEKGQIPGLLFTFPAGK